ncbi:MAG: TIGR01777 family oxidoreductase [Pyrinomonadaceae bacterium]
MRILVTGASGLIGTALREALAKKGWETLLVSRASPTDANQIQWDAESGFRIEDVTRLEGLDAVVHLAGEPVSGLRWTESKKQAIRDSRVYGTRSLVDTLAKLKHKPEVLVSASALGFYGDRGDDVMTESNMAGDTFLANTSREWEAESRRAEDLGIRTVIVRTGIVLAKLGGALSAMLTPFKFGVGGIIGSGKQWMSWISLDDIVAIYIEAITNGKLRGAINGVSPHPVTNEEFTKTMGDVLNRPTFVPLPEFAVNLVFGEMGDAFLLDSTRVIPKRLEDAGFQFMYPDLKGALNQALS